MKKYPNCIFDKCPVTNKMCDHKCSVPNDGNVKLMGIACDAYKVKTFKKRLKKNGFLNFEVVPQRVFTLIKVAIFPEDAQKLQTLIEKINRSFK